MIFIKKVIKDYALITLGIICVAISLEYFFAPNDLAAGGVTGLAIILNHYIPILSTSVLVLMMNLILFVIAFIFIGGNFGAKTIYASFGLTGVMWVIENFFNPQAITTDLFIASIFGTFITACGMALIFNVNASTGGTDILAKILNKFGNVDIGKSLLIVDFLVTVFGAITFGIDKAFYALLCVIINGIAIDRFIEGLNSCKAITIISSKNVEISEFIIKELQRGCTFLHGTGVYSQQDTKILYSVLGRVEFIKLRNYIKEIDPKAFITVGEAYEVLGEGFKSIEQ